jgi:2-octaprenylphenol hydroxylase
MHEPSNSSGYLKPTLTFDVIIVGAGIAGSALACALGNSGLSVAIIETQKPSLEWPEQSNSVSGFDPRVSALTVASENFLTQLDVWQVISERRASPYQFMHVWDADGTASIDFSAREVNQSHLGHIVENRIIVTALMQRLNNLSNVQIIAPSSFDRMVDDGDKKNVLLGDGRCLSAPLIVAADGARSIIREQAGFKTREWDYGHQAIVATVETELGHQQTAWQRFLPAGPLAFLPLNTSDGHTDFCSIVWSTLPQEAEVLMAQDDEAFAASLAMAFEHRLGGIKSVSRRFSFPLRQRHAVDYFKPGVVLVGDAAHTIHPLAGQGINIGLQDVQVLAEELLRAQERQLSVGHPSVLSRYQRRRKGNNLLMMAAMEGFKRLFAEPSLTVRWMRNSGMRWVDKTKPLKNKIVRQAMGF